MDISLLAFLLSGGDFTANFLTFAFAAAAVLVVAVAFGLALLPILLFVIRATSTAIGWLWDRRRALSVRLRASDPWRFAQHLREARGAEDGDDTVGAFVDGVAFMVSLVSGVALFAVALGIVGVESQAWAFDALTWLLGGAMVAAGAYAFHQRDKGDRIRLATWTMGLAIAALAVFAIIKGSDFLIARQAVESGEGSATGMLAFLRDQLVIPFWVLAAITTACLGWLADAGMRAMGRFALLLAGSALAALILWPPVMIWFAVALVLTGALGTVWFLSWVAAKLPATIYNWIVGSSLGARLRLEPIGGNDEQREAQERPEALASVAVPDRVEERALLPEMGAEGAGAPIMAIEPAKRRAGAARNGRTGTEVLPGPGNNMQIF